MANYDSYIVCTSPRSGSTLLCKLLEATGVTGNPASYFHRPSIDDWAADLGVIITRPDQEREALTELFRAAISQGDNGTGMFGVRLQAHSFPFFREKLAVLYPDEPTDADRFRAAFGRTLFLHLTRLDKVAQAVSYIKAHQTGLWHVAADGTELERLSPHTDAVYDRAAIERTVATMEAYDEAWYAWFNQETIEPHRISYDDLSADPLQILRNILNKLGVAHTALAGVQPGTRKIADQTNAVWVDRFRREHART